LPITKNKEIKSYVKNDQKIYIIPSKDLVIVRMGESANTSSFGLSNFDNDLWAKINALVD
jgi:hypothetical protein